MLVRQVHDLFQQRGQIQLVQVGDVHVLVEHYVRVRHQLVAVGLGRGRAHAHDGIDQRVQIPLDQGQYQRLQQVHVRVGNAADHAEVDPDGLAVADHDVALVGVAVERAHVQHLVDVIVQDHRSDLLRVIALLDQPVPLGNGIAVHKGHREKPLRGQLVDHRRAGDLLLVVNAVLLEEAGVLRLHPEVQLLVLHLFQFFDHRQQVDHLLVVLAGVADGVDQPCQLLQQHEILPHHVRDQRPLHLRDHLRAVLQHREVGLSDGCRPQGLVLELQEDVVDLPAGLLLDHRLGDLRVQLLHVLPQLFQLLAVALRQHVHTAGHDLADLNVGRSQVLKRCAQLHRRKAVGVEVVLGEHRHDLGSARLLQLFHRLHLAGEQLFHLFAHLRGGVLQLGLAALQLLVQVLLALHGHRGDDLDFALPLLVQPQGLLCVIHMSFLRMINLLFCQPSCPPAGGNICFLPYYYTTFFPT